MTVDNYQFQRLDLYEKSVEIKRIKELIEESWEKYTAILERYKEATECRNLQHQIEVNEKEIATLTQMKMDLQEKLNKHIQVITHARNCYSCLWAAASWRGEK